VDVLVTRTSLLLLLLLLLGRLRLVFLRVRELNIR
jgi:hypothetical protein